MRGAGGRGYLRGVLAGILLLGAGCVAAQPAAPADPTSDPPSPQESSAVSPASDPSPAETPRPQKDDRALVTHVVDGDTIEVAFAGEALDIRLIGIDTPETVHPSQPVECFGKAASRFTQRGLAGERVRLEFDVERLDRYGRMLAYVWLRGEMFNERLVREGYAQVATFPPNVKYVDRFLAAQQAAREAGRGLWSACSAGGAPTPPEGGGGGGPCDRESYPDVCIAPYPPDLDCADVPFSDFRVTGSDPHGFDGDDDGVGCES